MKKITTIVMLAVICAVIALSGCGTDSKTDSKKSSASKKNDTLTIGVIPQQTKGEVKKAMDALQKKLAKDLNKKVKVTVYPDYNGVVEAMNYNKVDMAYFGPLTYVEAHKDSGAKAIIAELINGKPYYHSYIITRKDSKIKSLDDLKAKASSLTFAFGDPNSTSGSLIPSKKLKSMGLFTDKKHTKFSHVIYTGSHDATALSIMQGNADVGAIDSVVFSVLDQKGTIDKNKFRILWKSKSLYEYPWAVQKKMDPKLVKSIQQSFLSIKDPVILNAFGASGFTKSQNSDFDDVKAAADEMGVLH